MANDFLSNAGNMALIAADQTPVGMVLPGGTIYRGVSALGNSMNPAWGQSWDRSRRDADAVAQQEANFQKLHPYLAGAAKGAGLAANLAIPGAVAGVGARAAARTAATEGLSAARGGLAATENAIHEGGAAMAGNAGRALLSQAQGGVTAAEQGLAAANAARPGLALPTWSNVMAGVRAMAPAGSTVGSVAKSAANYSPLAIPALPMLGAALSGGGQAAPAAAAPAQPAAPQGTPYQQNLAAIADRRPGRAPQNMQSQPGSVMADLTRPQQMAYDLQNQPRRPNLATLIKMRQAFPPYHQSASDRLMDKRVALAEAEYNQRIANGEDPVAARNHYNMMLGDAQAKGSGTYGLMNAMAGGASGAAGTSGNVSAYDDNGYPVR